MLKRQIVMSTGGIHSIATECLILGILEHPKIGQLLLSIIFRRHCHYLQHPICPWFRIVGNVKGTPTSCIIGRYYSIHITKVRVLKTAPGGGGDLGLRVCIWFELPKFKSPKHSVITKIQPIQLELPNISPRELMNTPEPRESENWDRNGGYKKLAYTFRRVESESSKASSTSGAMHASHRSP